MVDVHNKRCGAEGCQKRPTFNYPGAPQALPCPPSCGISLPLQTHVQPPLIRRALQPFLDPAAEWQRTAQVLMVRSCEHVQACAGMCAQARRRRTARRTSWTAWSTTGTACAPAQAAPATRPSSNWATRTPPSAARTARRAWCRCGLRVKPSLESGPLSGSLSLRPVQACTPSQEKHGAGGWAGAA